MSDIELIVRSILIKNLPHEIFRKYSNKSLIKLSSDIDGNIQETEPFELSTFNAQKEVLLLYKLYVFILLYLINIYIAILAL